MCGDCSRGQQRLREVEADRWAMVTEREASVTKAQIWLGKEHVHHPHPPGTQETVALPSPAASGRAGTSHCLSAGAVPGAASPEY